MGDADKLQALCARLGLTPPADPARLKLALTHSSRVAAAREQAPPGAELDNERLEFLGDAVLRLAVSDYLYRQHPALAEGEMSAARAWVVSDEHLAQVAAGLDLGRFLRLGDAELRNGGRHKPTLLACALEAVFGALFLERGLGEASRVILAVLGPSLDQAAVDRVRHNHKGQLLMLSQERFGCLPAYHEGAAEGPPHDRTFAATVSVAGRVLGAGRGRSKKEAEQRAAEQAWQALQADGEATRAKRSEAPAAAKKGQAPARRQPKPPAPRKRKE